MHDHKWFRECRQALGLEQRQLGVMLGFTPNSIYRKESERYQQKITARDARDLIALLRQSLEDPSEFPNMDKASVTAILNREGVVK